MLDPLVGPTIVPTCGHDCEVPPGITLIEVPPPRREAAWDDVLYCPIEGCGRVFLVDKTEDTLLAETMRNDD